MQCNKSSHCNLILGIESSCDDTGVAFYDLEKRSLLVDTVSSQIDLHAKYGGVVPELASRNHLEHLSPLIQKLMVQHNVSFSNVKAIAYTAGPGLIGALMVGACYAKALAFALKVPLIPVNHLEAHLLTPFIETGTPLFPFLGLLVSGGNTLLVLCKGLGQYQILGETLDDAVGEVFDKVAKKMGFPYPGGAKLAQLADQLQNSDLVLPIPMQKHAGLDFSFSGLKTHAINYLTRLPPEDYAKLAYAFQRSIVKALSIKTRKAMQQYPLPHFVLAGGVSANKKIRMAFSELAAKNHMTISLPLIKWSGDNGAMVAFTGSLYLKKYGGIKNNAVLAYPKLTLETNHNELWRAYEINQRMD